MTHILSLGAIKKLTGEYVYPKIANKQDEYICPECNKTLIFCNGEIRGRYFRHKVDNSCTYYNNPTETQIHKDAKSLLKSLIENKITITFIRNCYCCKQKEEFEIPEITETSSILLEYRFEYNGLKIADVVYIDNKERVCIFEIYHTHKTFSEDRPEPWFEIDAEELIKSANNTLKAMQIPCIRNEKCETCVEKRKNKERIARKKLFDWLTDKEENRPIEPFDFSTDDSYIYDVEEVLKDDMQTYHNCMDTIYPEPDIAIEHKSHPRYYIYFNKPVFTSEEFKILYDYGVEPYVIDVNWILDQTNRPSKIKCHLIQKESVSTNKILKNCQCNNCNNCKKKKVATDQLIEWIYKTYSYERIYKPSDENSNNLYSDESKKLMFWESIDSIFNLSLYDKYDIQLYKNLNCTKFKPTPEPDIGITVFNKPTYFIYLNKPTFTQKQLKDFEYHRIGVYYIDTNWILDQKMMPLKYELIKPILRGGRNISNKKNTKVRIDELYFNSRYVYLNVNFSEKNFVKRLGANWNKKYKLWYIFDDKFIKKRGDLEKYQIIWRCNVCHLCEECYFYEKKLCKNCYFCDECDPFDYDPYEDNPYEDNPYEDNKII